MASKVVKALIGFEASAPIQKHQAGRSGKGNVNRYVLRAAVLEP
jgi:hypothetical protein